MVEINALRHVDGAIIDCTVKPEARAASRERGDLALPEDAVVTLILRGRDVVMPCRDPCRGRPVGVRGFNPGWLQRRWVRCDHACFAA